MTTHNSELQLIGETVTISYLADPSASYGRFRLENSGDVDIIAAVESAWLEFGEQKQTFTRITVFNTEEDREMNSKSLEVKAKATLKFLLSFPRVPYEPRFGASGEVGLQINAGGVQLQALSRLNFVRRIPRV